MLELTSMTELCNVTASTATTPLQTYLTAVHYVQPVYTDRPKTQCFRWQRHTVCAQCKYAFLITHNELDPMTSVSFEYWISHNQLQCPLKLDLARTVGDRAHIWITDDLSEDQMMLFHFLVCSGVFLADWERRIWIWKQEAQTSGGVNHMFD